MFLYLFESCLNFGFSGLLVLGCLLDFVLSYCLCVDVLLATGLALCGLDSVFLC